MRAFVCGAVGRKCISNARVRGSNTIHTSSARFVVFSVAKLAFAVKSFFEGTSGAPRMILLQKRLVQAFVIRFIKLSKIDTFLTGRIFQMRKKQPRLMRFTKFL